MTRRRILLALGLSLLLLGGAFALLAIGWQAFKRDQGIERLDWHGLRLSPAQLALDRLELQRRDAEGAVQQLRLDGVRLHLAGLRPQTLEIARLSFDARSAGGEAAALVIIEAVVRLIPGFMGNPESPLDDSFSDGRLLEAPSYTRPASWRGLEVPEVLRSGDHAAVARWRAEQSESLTRERRPDLL